MLVILFPIYLDQGDVNTDVNEEENALPVGPRYVNELLPPSADDHCDVEAQDKRHRYETGEVVTVKNDALKHSVEWISIYNELIYLA